MGQGELVSGIEATTVALTADEELGPQSGDQRYGRNSGTRSSPRAAAFATSDRVHRGPKACSPQAHIGAAVMRLRRTLALPARAICSRGDGADPGCVDVRARHHGREDEADEEAVQIGATCAEVLRLEHRLECRPRRTRAPWASVTVGEGSAVVHRLVVSRSVASSLRDLEGRLLTRQRWAIRAVGAVNDLSRRRVSRP